MAGGNKPRILLAVSQDGLFELLGRPLQCNSPGCGRCGSVHACPKSSKGAGGISGPGCPVAEAGPARQACPWPWVPSLWGLAVGFPLGRPAPFGGGQQFAPRVRSRDFLPAVSPVVRTSR
eukprot:3077855-Amphidinium_carterae.1